MALCSNATTPYDERPAPRSRPFTLTRKLSGMELHPELRVAIDAGVHGHLITLGADGWPQVTMVWLGRDDNDVLLPISATARSCATSAATHASP